jgi:hypothetical protein
MKNSLTRICALAVLGLLCGCGLDGAQTVVTLACPEGWRTITINKADVLSEPTAQKIEGNNLARQASGCANSNPPAKTAPGKSAEPATS